MSFEQHLMSLLCCILGYTCIIEYNYVYLKSKLIIHSPVFTMYTSFLEKEGGSLGRFTFEVVLPLVGNAFSKQLCFAKQWLYIDNCTHKHSNCILHLKGNSKLNELVTDVIVSTGSKVAAPLLVLASHMVLCTTFLKHFERRVILFYW